MSHLLQNLLRRTALARAVRRLAKAPGFAAVAVLTLAVGIGANAAIFSIVDAVLIRPLPFPEADRLVAVGHGAPGLGMDRLNSSDALYLHYRKHAESFEGLALVEQGTVTLTGDGRPQRLRTGSLTPGGFELLRLVPIAGRFFSDSEGHPGGPKVVVLAESLWRRQFGSDPAIVGKTLELDGVDREVVGVVADIDFPRRDIDAWLPIEIDPENLDFGGFGNFSFARLATGVTVEQALAETEALALPMTRTFPEEEASKVLDDAGFHTQVYSLRDEVVGDIRAALWILLGTVGFVLLIACANVANLFLVRTEGRRRETAIETALGATRWRVAVGGVFEGLTLSLVAGSAGLLLAAAAIQLLQHFGPQQLPRLAEVEISGRVTLVTALLSIIAGCLLGLVPVLRSNFHELGAVLKEGGRTRTGGRDRHWVRHGLVVGQVAMALMLLIGAGLMVRSFDRLSKIDPGFRADENTVTFGLSLPEASYPDDESASRFLGRLLEELEALPGVHQAAMSSTIPLGGESSGSGHSIEGRELEAGEPPPIFRVELVSDTYLETIGARLVAGRTLTRQEMLSRSAVCLISQGAAERYWPDQKVLGQRIANQLDDDDVGWSTIVGVVGDMHTENLTQRPSETVYYPLLSPLENDWTARRMDLVLHFSGDRAALMDAARERVWSLDANLPIGEAQTLEFLVTRARAHMAFTVVLLLIAAAVALLLGSVGTYGVISYLVNERRGETGVRMALGAQPRQVAGIYVRQGLILAAVGAALGLVGAALASRAMSAILFEIDPLDPLTFALVPLVLMAVAALASAVPAMRATQVDPMIVLREE